ncbi:MAG: phosphate/phosphite/phosphonate ABC transporter substrate-binding protein [Rhodospirillales bacterium]|nr:phosphate/phosphite/phosphonate ABC transporter substrate-binding protein [Rhodospirillales bacterium]
MNGKDIKINCLLIAGLFVGGLLQVTTAKAETVYSFGVVPQFEPRKLANIWTPILKELEKRTGLKFKMVGSPKIPDFEAAFMGGEFDFAYMNPYHSLVAAEKQGYVPLVRDGARELYGILVVPKNSTIKSVGELKDKKIAFPAPNALGASLLMRADMATIYKISIRPVYVQTHSSVYLNVALGQTAAGGGVMGTFKSQPAEIRDALKILYKTRAMPPHPITAHARVSKKDRELVRKAFLDMGKSKEGAALLAEVPIKKIIAASVNDYKKLKSWKLNNFFVGSN